MEDENLVQKWIDSDKRLSDTLVEIENEEVSEIKQAEIAFNKIPKMYGLPSFPEDNEDEKFHSSVYEQLGLLNFLEPESQIKGKVLSSIFFIKRKLFSQYGFCLYQTIWH